MKSYRKSAIATVGATLFKVLMETSPAHAAIFTYDFTLNTLNNTFGFGSFTYDTSQLQDPSFPPLALTPKLTEFNVSFLGQTYNSVQFVNRTTVVSYIRTMQSTGKLVADRLVVPFPNCSVACIPALVIDDNSFVASSNPFGFPTAEGTVTYSLRTPSTSVPEPNFTFGLSALGLGWLLKKKIVSSQRTRA